MGSIELKRWRDSMISDRGDLLIQAAKRWLGPVKTPFNKHELLARVESFLRRPDTVAAVMDLMDDSDRLAVAALSLMGDLPPSTLERITMLEPSDLRGGNASRRLANLCERMIVYRYRNGRNRERIALVPPLAAAFAKAFTMSDLVFQAPIDAEPPAGENPWDLFCALFSACARVKPAFKNGMEFTKRAADLLAESAPCLVDGSAPTLFFLDCLAGSRALLPGENGKLVPDARRFVELADAFGENAALAMACAHSKCADRYLGPERRLGYLSFVLAALPRGVALDIFDVDRLAIAAASEYFAARVEAGDDALADMLEDDDGSLLDESGSYDLLEGLGLLERHGEQRLAVSGAADAKIPGSGHGPEIAVEESHEIKVLPEAGSPARAFMAAISRVERTGLVWTAVLDKDAALSAFSYGFDSAEIAARLESLSGKPLPQSVRFSLDTWAAQSRGVRVIPGIVAKLDEHNAAMLSHSPKAHGAIRETLAEGVFLLDAVTIKDAERLLRKAGIRVELQEQVDAEGLAAYPDAWSDTALETLKAIDSLAMPAQQPIRPLFQTPLRAATWPDRAKGGSGGKTMERLMEALDGMDLAAPARAVLVDKIRSRLILGADQLGKADLSMDVGAAGALDYPGKVRILERSMREGQPVEMAYLSTDGSRAAAMGIPAELRKTAAGLIVLLRLRNGDVSQVPVGAIDKLRLIHTDLFGA